MSDPAFEVKNIAKYYGDVKALDGVTLKAEKGKIFGLLGPNGAGKTTLVKILSTLISPTKGTVKVLGIDAIERPNQVRSVIGLTGQYAAIDEYLTGRENLLMIGRLYHLSKADAKNRTEELLQQFDLVKAADRSAKTYSGGMSRRLDLAASLIATPPVIFLDEPTIGLDPRSRIAMWDIIKSLVAAGSTILLTTQYLDEADQLADHIAVLDGGKVIAEGTSDQLKQKVGKERIEFTFKFMADLEKARKIITGNSIQIDEKQLNMSIPNDSGVRKLRELLEKLEKASVQVEGLSLHKPTLDDVFLRLTGHEASAIEEVDAKSKKEKNNG